MKLATSETISTSLIFSSIHISVALSIQLARRTMRFHPRHATAASSVIGARASAVGAYYDHQGAEKGEPVIVTRPIEGYSGEPQDAAGAEMKAIHGPCPRHGLFSR